MWFRMVDLQKNESGPWKQAYSDGKKNCVVIEWDYDPEVLEKYLIQVRPDAPVADEEE